MTETSAVRERDDIPEHLTWDLGRIYADWDAWERDVALVEAGNTRLHTLKGTLGDTAAAFRAALEATLEVREVLDRVYVYASMKSDEDTRIGDHLARDGRGGSLAVEYSEAVSWFEPELLALPEDRLAGYLAEDPGLALYAHFIDEIRLSAPHTLPEQQEALLAAVGNVTRGASQVFSALDNADLTFAKVRDETGAEVELTKARYSRLVRVADREVRRQAFESFMDAYGGVANTMAANMDANIKNHVFYAKARGYPGCLEAALHPVNVPVDVFHSLIGTVRSNAEHIHRYTTIKKQVLGLDVLREHDLYMPLFPDGEFTFDYDEACARMIASLAPLGPEYVDAVRGGIERRWLDVHENAGKRGGAYSSGSYGTDPYILLNWSGQLRDTFTLTHEMGHSMHSWFTGRHQPFVYADYPIFTAEVASTFNEMLLMRHLLDETEDPARRLYLLDVFLDQINATVFRQTMFAEMEHAMHLAGERGETLTAESLDAMYLEILKAYWGPDVFFDEVRSPRTWCRIPHFYYNYYVYQYATAFAGSAALARRVLEGGEAERNDYLGFLKSGDSRYPVETLAAAGVDLTTSRPVDDVVALFVSLMDEMEALVQEVPQ